MSGPRMDVMEKQGANGVEAGGKGALEAVGNGKGATAKGANGKGNYGAGYYGKGDYGKGDFYGKGGYGDGY